MDIVSIPLMYPKDWLNLSNQIFLESIGHTESENMSQFPIVNHGKKSCAKCNDIKYPITDNG